MVRLVNGIKKKYNISEDQAIKEAFDYYDWNKSGIISVKVDFL